MSTVSLDYLSEFVLHVLQRERRATDTCSAERLTPTAGGRQRGPRADYRW